MNRFKIILCSLVILGVFSTVSQAQIFGIGHLGPDGLSTLYQISPVSGAATAIGPIGFERCSGMDFNTDGILFATCERADGSNTSVLVRIDPNTGAGTEIGPTGANGSIADISFRNSDSVLFAYDTTSDPEHTVYTINTSTGQASVVGDTGLFAANGNGMTFDISDLLFHSQTRPSTNMPRLFLINQDNGQATLLKDLSVEGPPAQRNYRLAAMDAGPRTGRIFGILNDSRGGQGIFGPRYLAILDVESGVISVIGQTEDGMDAVALVETTRVPALSATGSLILAVILLAAIILVLRRRIEVEI